jgi:hypothetical protein
MDKISRFRNQTTLAMPVDGMVRSGQMLALSALQFVRGAVMWSDIPAALQYSK